MATYENATTMVVYGTTEASSGIRNRGQTITFAPSAYDTSKFGIKEANYGANGVLGSFAAVDSKHLVYDYSNGTVGYIGYADAVKADNAGMYILTHVAALPADGVGGDGTFAGSAESRNAISAYYLVGVDLKYNITVEADENGTAEADMATAAEGTEVTLTATAATGYTFDKWEVIAGDITIASNKFTMPAENVRVKALFKSDS